MAEARHDLDSGKYVWMYIGFCIDSQLFFNQSINFYFSYFHLVFVSTMYDVYDTIRYDRILHSKSDSLVYSASKLKLKLVYYQRQV